MKINHFLFVLLLAGVSFASFIGVAHAMTCNYGLYGPSYAGDCQSLSGTCDDYSGCVPTWDYSYTHFANEVDYCWSPGGDPVTTQLDYSACLPTSSPDVPYCTLSVNPGIVTSGGTTQISATAGGGAYGLYVTASTGYFYASLSGSTYQYHVTQFSIAYPFTDYFTLYPTVNTAYTGNVYNTNGQYGYCFANVTVSMPDITAGSVSPTSATAGTATTFSATISNANALTGAGFTNLFQKATSAAGANVADIGTFARATSLATGGTAPASLLYTFPSSGTYYMRACADKSSATNTGVIAESNENNNCGAWTAVTVSNATCANGANNPPTCNACTIPLIWNGSSCVTPASCSAITIGTCDLSAVSSGSSSGSCHSGYSGSCNYSCNNGTWNMNSNSCTVPPPPSATISASPTRVRSTPPGNTSLITWTLSNTSCTAKRNGVSWNPGPSFSSSNSYLDTITGQTTYTITCTGVTPQSVTVNVIPAFQEF